MNEILTESFCERCGTRYTFEPVSNRRKSLSGIGALGRGIRHFVSDPGSSLDEAFAVARSEREQRSTATALEAFHRTFNFCLSCRQYTCSDCWNAVEGRCLSCAPTPESIAAVAPVDAADLVAPMDLAPVPAPMDAPAVEAAAAVEAEAEAEAEDSVEAQTAELEPFDLAELRAAVRASADAEAAAEADALANAETTAATEAAAAEAAAESIADAAAVAEADARLLAQAAAADAREVAKADARLLAQAAEADAIAAEEQVRAAAEAEAEAAAQAIAVQAAAEVFAAEAAAEAEAHAAQAEAQAQAIAAQAAAEARAAEAAAAAEAERHAAAEAAAVAAKAHATESEILALEPGLNLDDAIAAYERELAAAPSPSEASPEPVVEAALVDAEASSIASDVQPDVEAAQPEAEDSLSPAGVEAAARPFEPIPTAIGRPVPASAVEVPLEWPEPDVAAVLLEPAWPDTSAGAVGTAEPVAPAVPTPGGARPCPSCGLSLSANARFCRRCGTQQQVAGSPN